MKNFENVKMNIILIIAIMLLLFTICLVLYSDLFFQKERMNIQTNYIFEGGKDNLSQTLENIIPYMDTTSPKYLTAYQDQNTSIINIHNDILLAKAIEGLNYNDLTTLNIQNKIKDMYGDNYFITNKSLNVDGENICLYLNSYNNYSCSKQSIKQIKYKAKRKILDINISNLITLRENIIFYSEEEIDDTIIYKIYNDGTYQKVLKAFTNKDLINNNIVLNDYLDSLNEYYKVYSSNFKKNNNIYTWIGTNYEK